MYTENIWAPPPPLRGENLFGVTVTQDTYRAKIHKRGILLGQLIAKSIE